MPLGGSKGEDINGCWAEDRGPLGNGTVDAIIEGPWAGTGRALGDGTVDVITKGP